MKITKHIFVLLFVAIAACMTVSCNEADDADGYRFDYPAPQFDTNTELGTIQKELYDTYGCYFTPQFDDSFCNFDWSKNLSDSYTRVDIPETDYTYTVSYLKELKKVLASMPSFLTDRLPSYVLLVDSLKSSYWVSQSGSDSYEQIDSKIGKNQTNFIILAYAGKSFASQNLSEMRESWTQMFFERALTGFKAPEEFSELVAAQKSSIYEGYKITGKWTPKNDMAKFGFLADSYIRVTRISSRTLDRKGELSAEVYVGTMTAVQDMSLFIAFTMFRPADKKAETYALSDVYVQKEQQVKDFCKSTLGFELKEIDIK